MHIEWLSMSVCLSVTQSRPDKRAETPDWYIFWISDTKG